jgi:hypothetical protein
MVSSRHAVPARAQGDGRTGFGAEGHELGGMIQDSSRNLIDVARA